MYPLFIFFYSHASRSILSRHGRVDVAAQGLAGFDPRMGCWAGGTLG